VIKFIRIVLGITIAISSLLGGNVQAKSPNLPAKVDIVQSDLDGLVLEMNAPGYQFHKVSLSIGVNDRLSVQGADTTAEPGNPQVPVLSALIGVPPEAEIHIEIISDQSIRIPGTYLLSPAPSPVRLEGDLEQGRTIFFANEDTYSRHSYYPETPVQIENESWLRDQRIVRLAFYPFQYNPAQGTLLWHRQLRVQVTFSGDQRLMGADEQKSNNPFETILQKNLLNYETAKTWRSFETNHSDQRSSSIDLQSPGYKITTDHDGLYQITYGDLQSVGMDVDNVDPRNFRMTSQGQDVGIFVQGQNDSSFDPGDTITFYGQYFRGNRMAELYADEDRHWRNKFIYFSDNSLTTWDAQLNATMFEKYTDKNVYWLTVDESIVARMDEIDGTPGIAETPEYYWDTVYQEESHEWWSWHFTSEDTWFWESIRPNISTPSITNTYTATLTALATGEISATIRGEVVAKNFNSSSLGDHHTQVFINDQASAVDDATWDGHIRYAFGGQTLQANLIEGENELHFVAHQTENMISDWLYFDWFEIEYAREFEASANQLRFSNDQAGTYQYQSYGFTNGDIEVYDITSPITPTRVLNTVITTNGSGAYTVTFETTHDANAVYFIAAVGDSGVIQSPISISAYTPQDFSTIPGVDYVMITHRDFMTSTQTLANYRAAQGLSTLVVDIDELYNQFNYGIYHPIAIKNFLAFSFDHWDHPPAYAVLIGSGHWNLRGYEGDTVDYHHDPIYMPPNLAFVDPWQGEVDSTNLLANVIGNEDDILPDLAIGRIPVDNVAELNNVIDKIIGFEDVKGDWQRNILFVAENIPDSAGDFVASSEDIINNHLPPGYQPLRIYQNNYGCTSANSPECQAVTNAITSTLNYTGALFVNYTGHGANDRWSSEKILRTTAQEGRKDDSDYNHLITLENEGQLPIVLDMTCLTGYWIYPLDSKISLAVELLTLENAGCDNRREDKCLPNRILFRPDPNLFDLW